MAWSNNKFSNRCLLFNSRLTDCSFNNATSEVANNDMMPRTVCPSQHTYPDLKLSETDQQSAQISNSVTKTQSSIEVKTTSPSAFSTPYPSIGSTIVSNNPAAMIPASYGSSYLGVPSSYSLLSASASYYGGNCPTTNSSFMGGSVVGPSPLLYSNLCSSSSAIQHLFNNQEFHPRLNATDNGSTSTIPSLHEHHSFSNEIPTLQTARSNPACVNETNVWRPY